MVRIPKKEPRSVTVVEYIVTAALLFVALKLADSGLTVAMKMAVFCGSLAVGFAVCALNSFVYGRLCAGRERLDGRNVNTDV